MPTDAGAPQCRHCRQPLTDAQAFCSHCGASVNRRDIGGDSLPDRLQALLGKDVLVESEIGRGAMGVVFAGFDVSDASSCGWASRAYHHSAPFTSPAPP